MISLLIIVGLFGLVIGSFLNVVIYRLPLMLQAKWRTECAEYLNQPPSTTTSSSIFSLALPRSHCPHCKHTITAQHNIPLLSFLWLRGKCPYCKTRISWIYPLVEAVTALTSILIIYHFGLSWSAAWLLVFTWTLIALVFIDFQHMILPDLVTLPLLWLGLILNTSHMFCSATTAIIGASAGYLVLWSVAWAFKKIRKIDGMGHGDFKLLAVFGAWLGWQQLPFIILSSSLLGVIVGLSLILCKKHSMQKPLPFGPYIALAGWVAIIWGQPILTWYLHLGV